MLDKDKQHKLWSLVKKTSYREHIDIPDRTFVDFWEYMRTIEGDIRYVIVEHYNLDTGFFYKAYEEEDIKKDFKVYDDKLKYMFEDYFMTDGGNWEEILFIDLKTKRAYLINKKENGKLTKKQIK